MIVPLLIAGVALSALVTLSLLAAAGRADYDMAVMSQKRRRSRTDIGRNAAGEQVRRRHRRCKLMS